ncbi:MAG: sensor histidine kinase [Acidimicrobiales bacterium]
MTRRLLAGLITFTILVLFALEIPLGLGYAQRERGVVQSSLERDAAALSGLSAESLERQDLARVQLLAADYASRSGTDVILLSNQGRVITSAGRDNTTALASYLSARLARRGANPSLGGSFSGGRGSPTFMYTALSIQSDTAIDRGSGGVGTLVAAEGINALNDRISHYWFTLGGVGLAVVVLAGILGWLVARSVTRPLRQIEFAVARLGRGDLGSRANASTGPTELRSLAASFNDMADRLEELVASQRAFVADASHQLRSPLTALRLRLENLGSDTQGEADTDIEAAVDETYRLSRIVDGLLAIARAEGTRPQRQATELSALAQERAEAWGPLAEEKGVTLVVSAVPTRAWAVPGYIEQVLDNLLANALEASPPGTTVTLGVESVGSVAHLSVADEGPGMSEEDRAHAFDRFWRSEGNPQSGSGLGLAIVDQLVRACVGSVTLSPARPEADPGSGLRVEIELQPAPPGPEPL